MIIAQGLSKRYGQILALDNVSLRIRQGERITIIGRNGSGKTTFFRCLLGLCRYDGRLTVAGMEPCLKRGDVLKMVAYVPQIPPPLKLSVKDIIQLTSSLCDLKESDVIGYASALGLDIKENQKKQFSKLSGGMKQKLLISIALSRRPLILIMDEPSANLDPEGRSALYSIFNELPDDTTLLLSSHRADELKGLTTRVIELDMGRIIKDEEL